MITTLSSVIREIPEENKFKRVQFQSEKHIGVAIGDHILDLSVVAKFYPVEVQDALTQPQLNALMALGYDAWKVVREITQKLLLVGSELDKNAELKSR